MKPRRALPFVPVLALALALGLGSPAASAQSVSLAGQMGSKALLMIDGQSQVLSVGDSARGVRLLQLQGDTAVVESGGVRLTLRAGASPARIGSDGRGEAREAREILIPAGPGGHFVAGGTINGRAVQFMVDTGATLVALGEAEADRIGLPWRDGETALMNTANGTVPAHRVTLTRLRVGEVEVANVGAVVVPAAMPMVLLGNSFLSRFQMRRDNDVMRLEAR